MKFLGRIGVVFVFFTSTFCFAQQPSSSKPPSESLLNLNERLREQSELLNARKFAQDYRIGPEDLLEVSVADVPEYSRTVRVSASGEISLPWGIPPVKAAGLSPRELERFLTEALKKTIKEPQVSVFVREYKSDPVSVLGAVKTPGLYPIQTPKSLLEVLAMAQGFAEVGRPPGRTIIIMSKHSSGRTSASSSGPAAEDGAVPARETREIPIKQLLEATDPQWNVTIYPGDVVKVVPAGTVFVVGNVNRGGAFPLTEFDNISAIQALALAGGTTKAADKKRALIIRRDASGSRVEQKINLARVLNGRDPDLMLGPNDILFVPGSVGKESALRGVEAALQAATLLVYRLP